MPSQIRGLPARVPRSGFGAVRGSGQGPDRPRSGWFCTPRALFAGTLAALLWFGPAAVAAPPSVLGWVGTATAGDTASPFEVGDAPLDAETQALIEALTATAARPRAAPPPSAEWPAEGPWSRWVPQERLAETVARDLRGAFDTLPTLQSSLRGRLGGLRHLDLLRLERSVIDPERLDPWLYGGLWVHRGTSAAQATRLWTDDGVLTGRRAPQDPGLQAEVALQTHTADGGVGVLASLAAATDAAALRVSASFRSLEDLRVRTGTLAVDRRTAAQRFGLSARGRIFGRRGDLVRVDLGYDVDLQAAEGQTPPLGDLHLLQGTISLAEGPFLGRVTGGWTGLHGGLGEVRDLAQVSGSIRWMPGARARATTSPSLTGVDSASSSSWIRPRVRPSVEVGGLFLTATDAALERSEVFAKSGNRLGPVDLEVSARLSDQRAPDRNPGANLAVDGRLRVDVAGPLGVWVRYARSYAFLEVGGEEPETGDLFEGGPWLEGRWGWAQLGVWGARVGEGLAEVPAERAADFWGLSAEGAAVLFSRWVLAAAFSRAVGHLSAGGSLGPGPNLRGRATLRFRAPEWGGFAELGLRAALESEQDDVALQLLPVSEEPPPHLIVDLRGAATLAYGLRLHVAVSNVLDTAWTPWGTGPAAAGIDLRVRLEWATGRLERTPSSAPGSVLEWATKDFD